MPVEHSAYCFSSFDPLPCRVIRIWGIMPQLASITFIPHIAVIVLLLDPPFTSYFNHQASQHFPHNSQPPHHQYPPPQSAAAEQ